MKIPLSANAREPKLWQALLPVGLLIGLLSYNVLGVYGDESISGSNQMILLLAGFAALLLARSNGYSWHVLFDSIGQSIGNTASALLILLIIGALSGAWLVGGVIPAMIYYGLDLLQPEFFLPACVLVCSLVSLVTGSSWSTSATVGIALVGIGDGMGISMAMTAGAVVSGAYFGDKISPLSDTTNLAPAMAGAELFDHIRYMLITTIPTYLITLGVFVVLSLLQRPELSGASPDLIRSSIAQHFDISPWLFAPPLLVIGLIALKVPAIPAVLSGALAGLLSALIFQFELVLGLGGSSFQEIYRTLMDALTVTTQIETGSADLDKLLRSRGMEGMMGTIWLILCAMVFGGAMEGGGFLKRIGEWMMSRAKSDRSLFASTVATCLGLNVTASDQYLAIVVPGRMFAPLYKKRGLAPVNLSRTLEDAGTVSSALVPWNTCGAYQSGVLGVATGDYAAYAVFNWLSPITTLAVAYLGFRIKRIEPEAELSSAR